jgi:uncharacterized membrane protein
LDQTAGGITVVRLQLANVKAKASTIELDSNHLRIALKKCMFVIYAVSIYFVFVAFLSPIIYDTFPRISKTINYPLSAVCHQIYERCPVVFGVKTTLCARCLAVYSSYVIATSLVLMLSHATRAIKHDIVFGCLFLAPLFIDVIAATTLSFYSSTTVIRIATGALFGVGTCLLQMNIIGQRR